jgi:8-oxo-dGTP pyrophosphatase MutT (NUDIX family)
MRIEAAVLVPLYRLPDDDLMLVTVRRSEWGIHGGQIAFPGGKREPADASLWDTALREAREEIGLQAESVQHVADLPVEETLTTEFRVTPFLARIEPPARWVIDTHEISEVLEVRLSELTRPETHGEEYRSWSGWPAPRRVPFYRIGSHQLWGASYRILNPLIRQLSSGEIGI